MECTAAPTPTQNHHLQRNLHLKTQFATPLTNNTVTSAALEWLPGGSEIPDETNTRFAMDQGAVLPGGAGPVHRDILLMRLRPGQVIKLEAHATKGQAASDMQRSVLVVLR